MKRVGEKGCQTENMHSGVFSAAEKCIVLPRSIYYDTVSLKTIVEKRTALNASITLPYALTYLDSLVCTPSAQMIWFLL